MVSASKSPEHIEESITPDPQRLGKFLSRGKSTCLSRPKNFRLCSVVISFPRRYKRHKLYFEGCQAMDYMFMYYSGFI